MWSGRTCHFCKDGGVSDDGSGYPGAPPGWYPDPAGGPGQRWWDGYGWTEATNAPQAPPPPPAPTWPSMPPPPSVHHTIAPPGYGGYPNMYQSGPNRAQQLVAHELRLAPLGRVAIAISGVASLLNLIFAVDSASQYRVYGHLLHLEMQSPQNHPNLPSLPDSGARALVSLLAIAAVGGALVWQFRAATAAQGMGLPAKRSPGWGVAFWFIPVVNLWMPYQAIRDCLAPGDPNRAGVLRYWLCYVGLEVGTVLTILTLFFSTFTGVVFAILTALCALGVIAFAPRVVISIAAAHRAATTL